MSEQQPSLEQIIEWLDENGYGWDVGRSSEHFREARVWDWPNVIGRSRNHKLGAKDQLLQACSNAGLTIPGVQMPEITYPRT